MDILYGEFLWGIFKNRHLSNATGRIRDESLINQGGRGKNTNNAKTEVRFKQLIRDAFTIANFGDQFK
jgi:hypothetical protein